jgi:hypothetical protein
MSKNTTPNEALAYGCLPSLPSSCSAGLSNVRHFQYLTLLFGFVNEFSRPAIVQLFLLTVAISNSSFDLSVWLIDVDHDFQQFLSYY